MKLCLKSFLTLMILGIPSFSFAEDLTEIDPDMANTYGTYLVKIFKEKVDNPQIELEEDLESAVGLHNGSEGMILIPTNLPEDPEGSEEVNSEKGAGLAYLFLSEKYTPVVDGKPIDKEKLRYLEVTTDSGETKKALVLILAAKHTEDNDWFMYVYGKGEEPIIKSQFGGAEEARPEPISLNIFEEEGEEEAVLAVTVKEYYEATFQIKK